MERNDFYFFVSIGTQMKNRQNNLFNRIAIEEPVYSIRQLNRKKMKKKITPKVSCTSFSVRASSERMH